MVWVEVCTQRRARHSGSTRVECEANNKACTECEEKGGGEGELKEGRQARAPV